MPLFGLLAAFASPVLYGLSNIIDSHFSNRLQHIFPLVFLSSLISLIMLPIVWFLDAPSFLSYKLIFIVFGIAGIEVLYQFPYYWALRRTDTSIVVALFSLGRAFVPIMAFFLVGELLTPLQYLGIAIIIVASLSLTFDIRKLRVNSALILMMFVTVALSLQTVLFKYLFEAGAGWGTGVTWVAAIQASMVLVLVLIPANFRTLATSAKELKGSYWLLIANNFLDWVSAMVTYYALFLLSASVVKSIASTQSIVVLAASFLLAKVYPKVFKEKPGLKDALHKIPFLLLMMLGVALVLL